MARTRGRRAGVKRAAPKSEPPRTREIIARKPLAHEVVRVIAEKGLNQVAAGLIVREQQSQISLVSSGRLAGFSPERLIRMLTRLGRNVDVVIRPSGAPRPGRVHIIIQHAKRAAGPAKRTRRR
jgi:predicted XRE-type DNA-binding protein